ncbi:MAG: 5'/3'-nucleotidase SurE [bacterium]|nr:5'/3'-nucleotidase SurE [bacterium]
MKLLITNDDGINGQGLKPLIRSLKKLSPDVVTIVPDRERSAVSQAITLSAPIRMTKISSRTYTIDGTPTDCVYLTVLGALPGRLPDIVISGINRGANLSEDIVYSGTVAAAIEAALAGIKSFAISMDAYQGNIHYETGARFAQKFVRLLSAMKVPKGLFFNINIPNLAPGRVKGVKITKLGSRKYLDKLIKRHDPNGNPYFWLSGDEVLWKEEKNTDYSEVKKGFISITPLHLDLTAYEFIGKLKRTAGTLLTK